ncbi:putative transposable element [Trichonephila clavipes]|nr:putative transposable element [Trichonephila clavipes]
MPPSHIQPTNQDSLTNQGPPTSGHIYKIRYGMEERFAFHFRSDDQRPIIPSLLKSVFFPVNGDLYRAMITNFFIHELNKHDVQELWFQQDGATCHTARATIDLLKDTFGDRLISRFGPVNWPPRSCDLTPLDYFLWGYVKLLVYTDKPQMLDHVEDNIRRVTADIRTQMLEKVIENWTSRFYYIRASRGSHMPEIIFKMKCPKNFFRIKKIHVHRIIHRCFIAI